MLCLFINNDNKNGIMITNIYFKFYYPTALKVCRGIVFTHGVRMGGQAGGWVARWREKFVWPVSQKL